MTKPKKPPVIVICVDCSVELEKTKACAWRAGRLRTWTCQACATRRLRGMAGELT